MEPFTKGLGECLRSESLTSRHLLHLRSRGCIGTYAVMACVGVCVCMAKTSRRTRHYSLLKTVYSPACCLVSDLIENVYATPVC